MKISSLSFYQYFRKMSSINFSKDTKHFLFIVIIVIIAVGVIFGLRWQREKEQAMQVALTNVEAKLLSQRVPGPLYAIHGTITDIDGQKISVRAPYDNARTKGEDTLNVTATLSEQTKFFKVELESNPRTKQVTYGETKEIRQSDLKRGDKIVIESGKNLTTNYEIEASLIYVVNTT